MSDRIAVMDGGRVLQVGSPEEIYDTPSTQFVADFIGETNFVKGELVSKTGDKGLVKLDDHTNIQAVLADPDTSINKTVTVAIRPEKVSLFPIEGTVKYPDGSSDAANEYKTALLRDPDINMIVGTIQQAVYIGTDTRYVVQIAGGNEVVVRVQNYGLRSDTYFDAGQQVNVFWDYENSRVLVS